MNAFRQKNERQQADTEIIPRPHLTEKEKQIQEILKLADLYRDARVGWANEMRARLEQYLKAAL